MVTVAYWLERSACKVGSRPTGSSLDRDRYCVGTLSKFFAQNWLCNTIAFSPPRHVSGRASDWCALRTALYKCIDAIQLQELTLCVSPDNDIIISNCIINIIYIST